MSEKKMPAFRLKYRDKESRITYDCGVCWPGRFEDSFDVQPQIGTDTSGKYPKMDTAEALRNVAEKRGWLSLSRARPAAGRPSHNLPPFDGGGGDGFGDPDLPF